MGGKSVKNSIGEPCFSPLGFISQQRWEQRVSAGLGSTSEPAGVEQVDGPPASPPETGTLLPPSHRRPPARCELLQAGPPLPPPPTQAFLRKSVEWTLLNG